MTEETPEWINLQRDYLGVTFGKTERDGTMKLAQALLRRKELHSKVEQIRPLTNKDIYEVKVQRRNISETIDDITATVPKVELKQVTAEFDYYSSQLRHVDAAIQQANWTTEIKPEIEVMKNYKEA
jgi:glucan phosphorylase